MERPMIKLYRRDSTGVFEYHEAWVSDSEIVEHWGTVGGRGQRRVTALDENQDETSALEGVLSEARAEGFASLPEDAHSCLRIEYPIQGRGCGADLARRAALEERLNQLLGWAGLGQTGTSSIVPGTLSIVCHVVDPQLAKRCISNGLLGTEFDDYRELGVA